MEVKYSIFLVFLIKLLFLINKINSNEVLGCGGFIKSHADIDFSKVEVKLLTKQGSLKDKTDCSPSNGYYFLPVYDKGEYILKISPPPGWSFEPEFVHLNFDGKTDICSQGKDVNFNFKGFGITGKVGLTGHMSGAKSVTVELRSENGEDVRKTTTDINGIFSFTPIIPGKYHVKATHNKWHFSKSEYTVVVETGNTELPEGSLIVSGFDVLGKILSSGQPPSNVEILLFEENNQKSPSYCTKTEVSRIKPSLQKYKSNPICIASVDKSGEFIFNGLAPGKYLITPFVSNQELKLHIKPPFQEFQVGRDTLTLKENFEITGFSVTGRVLVSTNGWGVPNAKIIVNGQYATITHTDGSYILENIKGGTYNLQVEADNLQFSESTIKISLTNPVVPDIIVSAYKVCGQVVSKTERNIGIAKLGSTFYTTATSHPGTGEWCTYLTRGQYTAEVLITTDDKSNGIQFFPLKQNIEVSNSAISGIMFSQLRATIVGEIKCLADSSFNCKNIEVTLHVLDSNGKATGHNTVISAIDGKYKFTEVLPGTYQISIPSSNLCWDKTSTKLNVITASETVPAFTHVGYEISVISSHRAMMEYSLKKLPGKKTKIDLMSGVNAFCVTQAGEYNISLFGCHKYDSNLPKSFLTDDGKPLIITATAHKTGLRILSELEIDKFKVLVERKSGRETVNFEKESIKVDGYYSYVHTTYLQAEEILTLTPQSSVMLFKPKSKEILGTNECIDVAFSFLATRGLIIEGKIEPPIKDTTITLTFPKNPELDPIQTVSSSRGTFKFGPLDGSLDVELRAEKESYIFSEFNSIDNTFKAHKLCEIIAVVKDEGGNKLHGVLLSLSGAESYRKNLVTGNDGTIKFHSLSPSQYYLRPMMKEYKFNPNSKIIEVQDGETVQVELIGNRVAYSIFGVITSLNGDPFGNVVVEAISDEACMHHQEESTSENTGQYRIRGLQPGCTYTVRMKIGEANSNVERSIPEYRSVKIGTEDTKNVNLIAISPFGFVDVIARVFASSNDYYKTLRIQMYRKGSVDSPIYSQKLETPLNPKGRINPGIMVFFPRIPLDGKVYFVELKTTISEKLYKFVLPTAQFVANSSSVFVELNFSPELKTTESDLNQNSISALILIALVAIAFFRQDLAMDFINFVWNKVSTLVQDLMEKQTKKRDFKHTETINYKEIEQLAEGINAVKKRKQTKKI